MRFEAQASSVGWDGRKIRLGERSSMFGSHVEDQTGEAARRFQSLPRALTDDSLACLSLSGNSVPFRGPGTRNLSSVLAHLKDHLVIAGSVLAAFRC